MIDNSKEALLENGFTERMADEYLEKFASEEASGFFDKDYMEWAHSVGFYAQSASTIGLTPENYQDYLSDYEIDRIWPLNDWQRIWINDKLTLGYMLAGTEFEYLLPEYYYYTAKDRLLPLYKSGYKDGIDGFCEVLQEKGKFACKPANGSLAAGFHLLEYKDGTFYVDGTDSDKNGIEQFVNENKNFIFQEFIRPSEEMAKIDPLIHTLRVTYVNTTGTNPHAISSYLRFGIGKDKSGVSANYAPPTSNDIGAYTLAFNIDTGEYGDGVIVYASKNVPSRCHPDSGVPAEGVIKEWPELNETLLKLSMRLGPLQYLGYDIGMTDKGPMLMEINSHPGVEYVQLHTPLIKDPRAGEFYKAKIKEIDDMTPEQKRARNKIWH